MDRFKDDTDATIQTAKYDGSGRRMKKVVSNSGDFEKTFRVSWSPREAEPCSAAYMIRVSHANAVRKAWLESSTVRVCT